MSSAICTLFEGSYHYGVAVLANSLFNQGYKGDLYAGYRGPLPIWCQNAKTNEFIDWPNSKTLEVTNDFRIHFIPLKTNYHFTNFKPDFMLELWNGPAKDSEAMFYFDPDIVLTHKWSFFEEWITYGIALCEDINSPLPRNHPRRAAWQKHFELCNIKLNYKGSLYANGGFVGVSKANYNFLQVWKNVQEIIAPLFGGLGKSSLEVVALAEIFLDYYYPFSKTDQDALNIAAEAFDGNISFIGKEAMGFKSGLALMPHALGYNKPWNTNVFRKLLSGRKPRLVDKEYWLNAQKGPVFIYSSSSIRSKLITIKFASFLGRFYCR